MEASNSWNAYYEAQGAKPPRAELVDALAFVSNKDAALDLGAGSLRDSIYLLDQGFRHVTAVDSNPSVGEIGKDLSTLEIVISKFEDFNFPEETFDIISAQYSLPFISPLEFEKVFLKIKKSLKKGGIFTGQFFGNKDEWNLYSRSMTFLTKEKSLKLVKNMDIIKFTEEEKDEKTAGGVDKHWHIFNMILRRP